MTLYKGSSGCVWTPACSLGTNPSPLGSCFRHTLPGDLERSMDWSDGAEHSFIQLWWRADLAVVGRRCAPYLSRAASLWHGDASQTPGYFSGVFSQARVKWWIVCFLQMWGFVGTAFVHSAELRPPRPACKDPGPRDHLSWFTEEW